VAQYGGGTLYLTGSRTLFYAAAVVAAVDLALALRVRLIMHSQALRSTPEPEALDRAVSPAGDTKSITFVRMGWLANLGSAVAVSTVLHLFPSLAVSLGIEANVHGEILAGMRIVAISVYLVLHRTTFWQHRFVSNVVVQLAAIGGLLVVFFAGQPTTLLAGLSGIALLVGFTYFSGIYYGSTGHEEKRRGFASGMHEASLGLGIAVGSAAGGLLGSVFGERSPYLFAAAVVAVLLGMQTALYARSRRGFAVSELMDEPPVLSSQGDLSRDRSG